MTTLINGKETGQTIQTQIKKEVEDLVKASHPVLLWSSREWPASQVYVNKKNMRRTRNHISQHKLSAQTSQDELEGWWQTGEDPASMAFSVVSTSQGLYEDRVIHTISTDKDVDGLHPFNVVSWQPASHGLFHVPHGEWCSCSNMQEYKLKANTLWYSDAAI